jgi:hypothetical protein
MIGLGRRSAGHVRRLVQGIAGTGLLLMLLGTLACTRSADRVEASPTALQAAAVAFLARANGDEGPCVHIASGPDELTRGRVTAPLQDPPSEFARRLKKQGLTVRAFSACSLRDRDTLTYAIGWPRSTHTGFELHADRLCGVRCGEGP